MGIGGMALAGAGGLVGGLLIANGELLLDLNDKDASSFFFFFFFFPLFRYDSSTSSR